MTDYAGTFERYFREYSDNGLDRRQTISLSSASKLAPLSVKASAVGTLKVTFTLICMGSAAAMLISIWIP